MKRRHSVGLVVVAVTLSWAQGLACGDKFLVFSRGLTFQQAYKPAHLAAVLIYAPDTLPSSVTLANAKLRAALILVGHQVTVARDAAELSRALASTKTDLVLAHLSEAQALAQQSAAAPTRPTILPVIDRATKADMDACKTRFLCQLKTTDTPERFLTTIDAAMKRRMKSGTGAGPGA